VARTTEEIERLWRAHRGTPSPLPGDGRTVIGVFAGERPTGGYQIAVERVEMREGRLRVSVRDTAPPPGAPVTQSLTYPYHIVAIPRTNLPVEFLQTLP
jgi:hypothetical protein